MPGVVQASTDDAEADVLIVSEASSRGERQPPSTLGIGAVIAIVIVGGFDLLFRLGVPDWKVDEITYSKAGWLAFHGTGLATAEHPPFGKHIIGLFEVLFGRSPTPVRASAVVAAILTGVFLALIAWRMAGGWAAVATAAVWFVLPHAGNYKFERFAFLDVFMAMFTTLALLFAVCWGESRKWIWVVAAGAAAGVATSCKVPGVLVLAPIGVYVLARSRFSLRSWLQAAAMAGAAVAAFVATYIPFVRKMPHELHYMVEFQQRQRRRGHPVLVGGHLYKHPPWWAQFRWQWDASWILAVCYLIIVIFAIAIAVSRRDANRSLLLATFGVTTGFFAFVSRNVLAHYTYAWAPVLAVIVGVTLHDLARPRGRARTTAVVLALALVIPAVQLIESTARIRQTDYAAAAALLRKNAGPQPRVALAGHKELLQAYLPGVKIVSTAPTNVAAATAVVIDPAFLRGRTGEVQTTVTARSPGLILRKAGRLFVYVSAT